MPLPALRLRALASPALAVTGFLVWSLALSSPARADEIVTRHPDTCEIVTIKAAEILPETWTEVEYRERDKGPTKKVPMSLVLEVRRNSGGKDKSNLEAAVQELERGNFADARSALKDIAGGGFSMLDGQRVFTSFMPKGTGTAKGKRPIWTAEYAHFFYARALVQDGLKTGNAKLLEEALLVLDDVPNPAPAPPPKESKKEEKDPDAGTTGGFLGRFKGGNSRWIPEAMHWKARALVGLKRFDEAAAVWDELFNQAVGVGLSPRWVFEAKVGPGLIAEAQGDTNKAVQAYERAPTALEALLAQPTNNRCLRLEIGRYFSQVRARAAALLLDKAQNGGGPSAYVTLKTFLVEGQPEALQARFASRPADQLEALMAGARDPQVQAVAQTGLGLSFLNEQKYDEAILALTSVAVRYFSAREYAANALFHLAKAADAAALAAKPAAKDAKATYLAIKDSAVTKLKTEYPESPYATK